jgi:iron complex outermembrane receptor protein
MSSKYRSSQQSLAAAVLACMPMLSNAALEEVLVTAERREASLQEVPASVSALSEMTLENKKIENITDIQYQVPNLSIGTNTGTSNTARMFLRGIGEDESRATDPAVGMYVDGVYIGRAVGALVEVVDLAQIEVRAPGYAVRPQLECRCGQAGQSQARCHRELSEAGYHGRQR